MSVLVPVLGLLTAGLVGHACLPDRFIVLNLSASLDPGFYVLSSQPIAKGTLIEFHLPQWFRDQCDETALYCRSRVPLLKRIAAGPGDRVSTLGTWLRINGDRVGAIATHDSEGRPLPIWQDECMLPEGQYFLLGQVSNSLDSRYFGPIRKEEVVATRIPLFTW